MLQAPWQGLLLAVGALHPHLFGHDGLCRAASAGIHGRPHAVRHLFRRDRRCGLRHDLYARVVHGGSGFYHHLHQIRCAASAAWKDLLCHRLLDGTRGRIHLPRHRRHHLRPAHQLCDGHGGGQAHVRRQRRQAGAHHHGIRRPRGQGHRHLLWPGQHAYRCEGGFPIR